MPKITVGTDIVNFPDNGSDALWSPAVIQFAQLVSEELQGLVNDYDIAPTVFNLTGNANPSTVDLQISFNKDFVRKFSLSYAIYRETETIQIVESGTLTGIYDSGSSEWFLQDEYFGDRKVIPGNSEDGKPYHSFAIDSEDKIILTIQQLLGTINTAKSKISFSAKTELVSL